MAVSAVEGSSRTSPFDPGCRRPRFGGRVAKVSQGRPARTESIWEMTSSLREMYHVIQRAQVKMIHPDFTQLLSLLPSTHTDDKQSCIESVADGPHLEVATPGSPACVAIAYMYT